MFWIYGNVDFLLMDVVMLCMSGLEFVDCVFRFFLEMCVVFMFGYLDFKLNGNLMDIRVYKLICKFFLFNEMVFVI